MCCASTLLVRQVPFPSSTRVLFPGDGGFCAFGLLTQRDIALRAGGGLLRSRTGRAVQARNLEPRFGEQNAFCCLRGKVRMSPLASSRRP